MLQVDLDTVSAWFGLWLLKFIALKCVVIKIRDALYFIYILNGVG